jgi:hypothetical protein
MEQAGWAVTSSWAGRIAAARSKAPTRNEILKPFRITARLLQKTTAPTCVDFTNSIEWCKILQGTSEEEQEKD